jgi:spore germination cell wall hydrolase CwlJ-like protein
MEARGESLVGQISVAKVIQNRMARESATICEVISKKHQFPWFDNTIKTGKHTIIFKKPSFDKSLTVAQLVLEDPTINDPTSGATFFHGRAENPSWSKKLKLTLVEGGHRFYKER